MSGRPLLYLHGFTSGPQSHKAQVLVRRMAERGLAASFLCPQLLASPKDSVSLAANLIERHTVGTLVGSSLGGYYATVLAERYGLRAVLVNPAVVSRLRPESLLGTHRWLYGDTAFEFTPEHVDELRAMECGPLRSASNYWLLTETGDETLDYHHAVDRYAGARQTVLEGGDHSFTRWEAYLDDILKFAGFDVAKAN